MLAKNSICKSLFWREALMIKYNFNELLLSAVSCLVTVLVFSLVFNSPTEGLGNINFYGLLLIITTLTISFSDHLSIQHDFRSGVLEQLFLLPISPFKIILVKFCVASIKYIIFHSIFWAMVCEAFADINFATVFLDYCLFSLHLMSISLLVSSIGIGIEQYKNTFATLLVTPLIFPQIIFSLLSISDSIYFYLVLSLSILMTPVLIMFSTVAIQNAVSSNS